MAVYRIGSQGLEVQFIQQALGWEGIDGELRRTSLKASGEWDGIYGVGTVEAVKIFQSRMGLPVTGEVDDTTWDYLVGGFRPLIPIPTPKEIWEMPVITPEEYKRIYGVEMPWFMPILPTPTPIPSPTLPPVGKINWVLVAGIGAAVIIGIIAIVGTTKKAEVK